MVVWKKNGEKPLVIFELDFVERLKDEDLI